MERLNLDKLHVSFDPACWQKPRRGKRKAILIDQWGRTLEGITILYQKENMDRIEVPTELGISNRPEYDKRTVPLSELDREQLRIWIREKLLYRPDPSGSPDPGSPGESVDLLRKARTTRSGRRN